MADCRLMLDFNGADGDTATFDRMGRHFGITFNGTAQLSTANVKFGLSNLLLDGDSDFLTLAASSDWNIVAVASESWTVDFFTKHADHAGTEVYLTQAVDANNYWRISHSHGSGLRFHLVVNGTTIIDTGSGGEITDILWHHVAFVRIGDEYGLYLDGTQVAYVQDSSLGSIAADLFSGQSGYSSGWFDGRIDRLRIDKSNHFGAAPNAGKTDTIDVFVPAGHWELADDLATTAVIDNSGNANPGTLNGGDNTEDKNWPTDRGDGMKVNGTDDDITIGLQTELQWGSGDGSILAWIIIGAADKPVGVADCVACCGDYSGKGYFFYVEINGQIDFRIYDGTTNKQITGKTDICDGQLHLIAGVRNGNQIECYLDGVSDDTPVDCTAVGDINDATYGFTIGALNNAGEANGNNIAAVLLGVQTYPGKVLTAAQLLAMYNDGINGKATPREWEQWELLPDFPTLSVNPEGPGWREEENPAAVKHSTSESGYDLTESRFTSDLAVWTHRRRYATSADKNTLRDFYRANKDRAIMWTNPDDGYKYMVKFRAPPVFDGGLSDTPWAISTSLKQVDSTVYS